ncbi:hypothetical protein [Nocardia sp. XZ_19_385]|uniref:DUF7373 family lipoprotein n=1 Tax=Nocardia sp. XZ_19_385 TaxID=2769488 RepID=UPI00188F9880|nr:hypothetical protein [Nocardia sp. XZ_19_385]
MISRNAVAIAVAVALMAVSGCGGDPGVDPAVIDVSKLDSGNYPAVPRDVEKSRTPQTGAALEGVRISNAMALTFEIDGRYPYQRLLSPERRITESTLPEIYNLSSEEIRELAAGFVAGADTSAERRKISPLISSSVAMTALRFPDAAQAEAATRRLAERQAMNLAGEAVQIPGFPQSRAKWSDSKKYLDAWLTHNAMVLYVHIGDPANEPSDITALAELAKRAFTGQIDRLAGYTATPAEQLGSLPLDTDGLLSRTLPWDGQQQRNKAWDQSAVMPPQAALHFDTAPALTKAAFDDAGVDLVAYSQSRVYRTRDSASATRLISALTDQRAEGWDPMDSPPNLPGVQCFTTKPKISNSDRYPPTCFLAYDRFAAQVTGKNAQELYQMAAAQYKLLAYKP